MAGPVGHLLKSLKSGVRKGEAAPGGGPSAPVSAAPVKAPGENGPKNCDVEPTKDELRKLTLEMRKRCSSPAGTTISAGSSLRTKTGTELNFVKSDSEGATLAFGAKGNYVVTTYVPFDSVTTLLDPPMMHGKVAEKLKALNHDLMVLLCPARSQHQGWLNIVTRTFGELRCDAARQRAFAKDLEIAELRSMVQRLEGEVRRLRQRPARREAEKQQEIRGRAAGTERPELKSTNPARRF
jgi:hypothetical protein